MNIIRYASYAGALAVVLSLGMAAADATLVLPTAFNVTANIVLFILTAISYYGFYVLGKRTGNKFLEYVSLTYIAGIVVAYGSLFIYLLSASRGYLEPYSMIKFRHVLLGIISYWLILSNIILAVLGIGVYMLKRQIGKVSGIFGILLGLMSLKLIFHLGGKPVIYDVLSYAVNLVEALYLLAASKVIDRKKHRF